MSVRKPTLTQIADTVTAATNSQFAIGVVRQNLPRVKVADLGTLKVIAAPATKKLERTSRDVHSNDTQIEIGFFQRIDEEPEEGARTEDQVIELVESVLEWWVDEVQGFTYTPDDAPDDHIPVKCTGGRLFNDEPFDTALRRESGVIRVFLQLDFKVI